MSTRSSSDLRGKEHTIDECKLRLQKSNQAISANKLEEQMLSRRLDQLEEQLSTTRASLAGRRSRLEELDAALAKNRRDSELAKLDIDKRVRLLESHKGELDAAREKHAAIKAQIKGVEEIDRAFENASPALSWMLAHESEFEGQMRPISDMFTVPSEYEILVERLLGADIFGLVVDDTESAELLANRLIKEGDGEGEISLMPLGGGRPQRRNVARDGKRLLDELTFGSDVASAANALLGDVYVVDTIGKAFEAQRHDTTGARFVTRDGAVVWPNGKLTLGVQSDDVEGVLARRRQLDSLKEDLETVTATLSEIELATSEAENNLKVAQEDGFELSQSIAMLAGENGSVREEVGRLEQSITTMQAEQQEVTEQRKGVEARSANSEPLIDELTQRIETLNGQVAEVQAKIDAGTDERLARTKAASEILEKISTCKVGLATAQTRSVYLKQRISSLEREIDDLERSVSASRRTQASLDLYAQRIEPLYDLFKQLSEGARVWATKLRDQAALEQSDSTTLKQTIEGAREAVRTSKAALDEKIESVADVRVAKGRLELQVDNAIKGIVDTGVLLETALQTRLPRTAVAWRTAL